MEMEYKRTWNQSILILKGGILKERYDWKMLEYNKIEGLLPVCLEGNEEVFLSYDITGKKSLDCYLENREIEVRLIKKLLEGLIHLCRELERHLLDENYLLLQEELIFLDENGEFYFCYCISEKNNLEKRNLKESFHQLLEELLPKLNHEEKDGVEAVYKLYELTGEENYSLLDLQEIFFEKEKESEVQIELEPELPVFFEEKKEEERRYTKLTKNPAFQVLEKGISFLQVDRLKERKKRQMPSVQEMEYVAEECSLPKTQAGYARLIYLGRGEERDFLLEQPVFLLGRDGKTADGVLKSKAVGNIQAKIYKKEDTYYIEDMNSAHGTLVNGELLTYKNAKKLEEGDRITFADISYRFLTFCHNSII